MVRILCRLALLGTTVVEVSMLSLRSAPTLSQLLPRPLAPTSCITGCDGLPRPRPRPRRGPGPIVITSSSSSRHTSTSILCSIFTTPSGPEPSLSPCLSNLNTAMLS